MFGCHTPRLRGVWPIHLARRSHTPLKAAMWGTRKAQADRALAGWRTTSTLSMMDLTHAKCLLIFGGSFDPPHRAHVTLPEQVRRQMNADAVIYIPAGAPPHKPALQLTPAAHRLAMLKLALQDNPHAVIDSIEIERAENGKPTYTIDTLVALAEQFPNAQLRLLIGADQMRTFDLWRNPNRVIALAEPVVLSRSGDESLPDPSWKDRLVHTPRMDISATELRQRMRANQPAGDWIGPDVARYIDEHGLYRG